MTTLEIVWRNPNPVRLHSKANRWSKSAKTGLIVGILLAAALAISARAQDNGGAQAPAIDEVIAALPKDPARIAAIVATQPQEPAGPGDILRSYELGMAFVRGVPTRDAKRRRS